MSESYELGSKIIPYGILAISTLMFIVTFSLILYSYVGNVNEVPEELKINLIVERFLSTCFAYQDEAKIYPRVLDVDKLNEDIMNDCYQAEKKDYNFALKIDDKIVRTYNYFGKTNFVVEKLVTLREEGKERPGVLRINVQRKI